MPEVLNDAHQWISGHHAKAEVWGLWQDPDDYVAKVMIEEEEHEAHSSFLEREFDSLVERWLSETSHVSSVLEIAMHPAYQRIIGMGKPVLPLLFRKLEQSHDHWLWALNAITGVDPARATDTFDEAVNAWLQWGREKGYLL